MRIGIFGGSFDPPHIGHLILAEYARTQLNLDYVLWVPVGEPPHKAVDTSAQHRLAMTEIAIHDNPAFRISHVDITRPGPHYSVDMISLIRENKPHIEPYFILGGDSLVDLPNWHQPDVLLKKVCLGVMRRVNTEIDLDELEQHFPNIRQCIQFFDAPLVSISSSELRKRIRDGLPVRYLLPTDVVMYIREYGLYA